MVVDEALLPRAQEVFKKARLTPEQAQAVTDAYQDLIAENMAQYANRLREWEGQAKKDTFLLDGGGFERNLATIRQTVNEYGDDELRELFDTTGAGSHPAMLRFIKKMARGLGEAKVPSGETSNRGTSLSHAETLYPSMVKR